ncbi:cytochrome P450 78A5-like [Panicum miliaceum]|uniref:Cytochrome P450 78A5-like n=1 Tax=Panicum miliaceum TaxID=4540 RepID=A0A3L6PIC7_PANMI|nr:cytochrome P450 78A5-like [Panicum miliaceum]
MQWWAPIPSPTRTSPTYTSSSALSRRLSACTHQAHQSWARLAVQDTHFGKHVVPAGTTAMVNMWAISHDKAVWGDPWVFRPERFTEQDLSVLGSDLRLAPFGSGRRVCPGRMMGLLTVKLWLGRLQQEYEWLPAKPIKLAECLRLSMEMKKPLLCRSVRRGEEAA